MRAERLEFSVRIRRTVHAGKLGRQEPDLLGFVADALKISNRLDDRDDQAKIPGRRRARREDTAALLVDVDLELVDLVIVPGAFEPEFAVATDNRFDRACQLLLDELGRELRLRLRLGSRWRSWR